MERVSVESGGRAALPDATYHGCVVAWRKLARASARPWHVGRQEGPAADSNPISFRVQKVPKSMKTNP